MYDVSLHKHAQRITDLQSSFSSSEKKTWIGTRKREIKKIKTV